MKPKLKKFYSTASTPMEKRWENAESEIYLGTGLVEYVRLYGGPNYSLAEKYLPQYSNGSKLNVWLLDLRLDGV